jgi:protein-L-isoaspartate(D-aspartate) O-methyltransferase
VLADAEDGVPGGAPYDRIIVTAGAWDIPPVWLSQLAPDGRLVVPLRLRGLTRTVAFEWDSDGLASRAYQLPAFVPFQGDGAHADDSVALCDGVVLQVDNPGLRVDTAALGAALDSPALQELLPAPTVPARNDASGLPVRERPDVVTREVEV